METEIYVTLLNEILKNVDEGVHFIDKDGNTVIYNESMEKMEKLNREYVMKNSFFDVVDTMAINGSTLLNVLKNKKTIKNNIQKYMDKNGREITAINSTMPIEINGEFIGALEISKDITIIQKLSEEVRENEESKSTKNDDSKIKGYKFDDIIGKSYLMKEAINKSRKASKSNASVFIYGETGTGKELISQAIHYYSNRKGFSFVAQNCAALPEALFEGILFGTVKGGFTGAIDRPGLIEQANNGTLLLDEINSMPMTLQAKLLRVLQEGYVRRVGGSTDIPVNIRVIATSNEPPSVILNENKIRKDLYYRLNVIYIEIPPLRYREGDIILLCNKFIEKYNNKLNKRVSSISQEAIEILKNYDWYGNVRQLENTIYSIMSLMEDEKQIEADMINLNEYYNIKEAKIEEGDDYMLELKYKNLDCIIGDIEEKYIFQALSESGYNITKAASILGTNRQNLQYKMKKYNIKNFNK